MSQYEAFTPEGFLETNLKFRDTILKELELKSRTAQKAVMELISKFLKSNPNLTVEPEKVTESLGLPAEPRDSQTEYTTPTSEAGQCKLDNIP